MLWGFGGLGSEAGIGEGNGFEFCVGGFGDWRGKKVGGVGGGARDLGLAGAILVPCLSHDWAMLGPCLEPCLGHAWAVSWAMIEPCLGHVFGHT